MAINDLTPEKMELQNTDYQATKTSQQMVEEANDEAVIDWARLKTDLACFIDDLETAVNAAISNADAAAARANAAADKVADIETIDDATAVAFIESLFEKKGE